MLGSLTPTDPWWTGGGSLPALWPQFLPLFGEVNDLQGHCRSGTGYVFLLPGAVQTGFHMGAGPTRPPPHHHASSALSHPPHSSVFFQNEKGRH